MVYVSTFSGRLREQLEGNGISFTLCLTSLPLSMLDDFYFKATILLPPAAARKSTTTVTPK